MRIDDLAGSVGVGFLASGGLSSWALVRFLKEMNVDVRVFCADVGQPYDPLWQAFRDDMRRVDVPVTLVNLRPQLARVAMDMLRYGARYEGGYWNSTGALRYVLVRELAPRLHAAGCGVMAHGCVAGGNDECRFLRYAGSCSQRLDVFSPFRDERVLEAFRDRADMARYLVERGADLRVEALCERSSDACLLGASYEGPDLESIERDFTHLRPAMSVMPWNAPDETTHITIGFEAGIPVSLDHQAQEPQQLLESANRIGGSHGLSLRAVVENRITEAKSRGVYESPGMDLLSFGFEHLLCACLSRPETEAYRGLSVQVARAIYAGQYDAPPIIAARRACESVGRRVAGVVKVALYRGNLFCTGMTLNVAAGAASVQQRRFAASGHTWSDAELMTRGTTSCPAAAGQRSRAPLSE